MSENQSQNQNQGQGQGQDEVQLDSAKISETVETLAKNLRSLIKSEVAPKIGIVSGSGLGSLVQMVSDGQIIPYRAIAGFPRTGVKGHEGNLVIGKLKVPEGATTGTNAAVEPPVAIIMQGRCHPYEGFTFWQSTLPIRVMHALGVQTVVLTNAAGALNHQFKPGDVMLIKDHIYIGAFAGANPLFGLRDASLGPRFISLWNIYEKDFRKLMQQSAAELQLDVTLREGVFVMFPGPTFETVSEARALRSMGGDAVAMSTAHEAIVARHCGMKVLALSVISNYVQLNYDDDDEDEKVEVEDKQEKHRDQVESANANGTDGSGSGRTKNGTTMARKDAVEAKLEHGNVLQTVELVTPKVAQLLLHTLPKILALEK